MRGSSYDDGGPYPGAALKANKAAYCAACGYICFLWRDEYASHGRPPGWDKLLALRAALFDANCSLALWLDADVVVLHPVDVAALARTPIGATKDYYGFNTGVMLLRRDPLTDRLLAAAWAQTAFVPNRLGAEQSALRLALYLDPALAKAATVYQNLVRYPMGYAMSARQKWNRTFRSAAPLFHTAGCAMNQRPHVCAEWLRTQLASAAATWQPAGRPPSATPSAVASTDAATAGGAPASVASTRSARTLAALMRAAAGGGGDRRAASSAAAAGAASTNARCEQLSAELLMPRRLKTSDAFIPYGQGRDVVVQTAEATRLERAALQRVERRACDTAGRRDVCDRGAGLAAQVAPNATLARPPARGHAARRRHDGG